MNPLPITSFVAAVLALLMLPLTMQVSMKRVMLGRAMRDIAGVAFGDGDDLTLRKRIRAFGNFIEYAPMGLVLLALAEHAGANATLMWTFGGCLITGRVIHALAMLYSDRPEGRAVGMMFTYVAIGGPAVFLLSRAL